MATSLPHAATPDPSLRTRYLPSDEMAIQRTWDACPMCRSSVPFFPPGTTHSLFPLSTSPMGKASPSPPESLPPLQKAPRSLPQRLKQCTCTSPEGLEAKPPREHPQSCSCRAQAGVKASHSPKETLAFDEGAVLGSRKDEPVIWRDDQAGDRQLVPPQHADAGWIRRLHLQGEQNVSWAAPAPFPGMGVPEHGTLSSPGCQQLALQVGEGPWSRSWHGTPSAGHLHLWRPGAAAGPSARAGEEAGGSAEAAAAPRERGRARRRHRD